jgi:hypothetical protein
MSVSPASWCLTTRRSQLPSGLDAKHWNWIFAPVVGVRVTGMARHEALGIRTLENAQRLERDGIARA